MTGRLLTTRQVAGRLSVSAETVLRMWRRGELAGYRISSSALRFSEEDLFEWLEARRSVGTRP